MIYYVGILIIALVAFTLTAIDYKKDNNADQRKDDLDT